MRKPGVSSAAQPESILHKVSILRLAYRLWNALLPGSKGPLFFSLPHEIALSCDSGEAQAGKL